MDDSGTKTYFDADEVVELLDYFEEKSNITQYEKLLEFGLKLHPENPDLKLRICKLLIFHEQYNEALHMITQLNCNNDEEAELLKIECLCALDNYDEVRHIIEVKQRQDDENLEELYEYTASVLGNLDDKQSELEELIHAGLRLFPDNQTLKEEYSYLLESQGYTDKALLVCNELIDIDPYFADYWYMAGRLHAETDDYDKAIESLNYAITCDESDMEIKIFRAYCLYKHDLFTEAVKEFREIFTAEPEEVDELIPAIATEYPVPADFRDVCIMFAILRNETKTENLTLPLFPGQTGEKTNPDIPDEILTLLARHLETLAEYVKQFFPDDDEKDSILHLRRPNDPDSENPYTSAEQLASRYLTEKYHNN
jgi:tetratricopeptide (TPR) repeat protein